MEFTLKGYGHLIDCLKDNNYGFANYKNYMNYDKCVILRHDVDYDIQKIVQMAEMEYDKKVSSTYFVLLTSDFYNLMSRESVEVIRTVHKMGHHIGLHFDQQCYGICDENWDIQTITQLMNKEIRVLSGIIGKKINAVSMHRPSPKMLEGKFELAGDAADSYSQEFFRNFKYLSDSRMRWREDVESIINSGIYQRIQLLTHPFWYFENEMTIKDIVEGFIYARGEVAKHRYKVMKDNITNLDAILR